MDTIIEKSWQPKKTATEYWLETYPTTEVKMNGPGCFAEEREILVTNGFNGCAALIVRIDMPNGKMKGFLAHKHAEPKRIDEFVNDLDSGEIPAGAKMYATILYPGGRYGRSLGKKTESFQEQLQQQLISKFGSQLCQLRSRRYAVYEGFPGSVNSNRLIYNVSANMWLNREGANDQEHPLSGLLKWDKQ